MDRLFSTVSSVAHKIHSEASHITHAAHRLHSEATHHLRGLRALPHDAVQKLIQVRDILDELTSPSHQPSRDANYNNMNGRRPPPSTSSSETGAELFKRKFKEKTNQELNITASKLAAVWFHCDDDDGSGHVGEPRSAGGAPTQPKTPPSSPIRRPNSALARKKSENFMRQFRSKTNREMLTISASQLLMIWGHYDWDGNGYIEGDELDKFLKEFVASVCENDVGNEVVSQTMLDELKRDFLDAYDDNGDGKIEIRELAQLLPVDENFLLIFQLDNRLTSSMDFVRTWKQYDTNGSGYIEAEELKSFLRDLLQKSQKQNGMAHETVPEEKLQEYADAILRIFDKNNDGRLQLSELSGLLPVKENAMKATIGKRFLSKEARPLSHQEIQEIFKAYDRDDSGLIEGEEVAGFVLDLLELMQPNYTADDALKLRNFLMSACDLDGDGCLSKDELTLIMLGLQRFNNKIIT